MPITHAKVSSRSDGSDATQVQPSDWNAEHVGSAGSDTRVTVDISAAQIRNIVASPVELIPAPGAGKVIWPKVMFMHFTFVSVAYDSAVVFPSFAGGFGTIVESAQAVNKTSSFVHSEPLALYGGEDGSVTYENLALQLVATPGDPGSSGDGTLRIILDYEIVTL